LVQLSYNYAQFVKVAQSDLSNIIYHQKSIRMLEIKSDCNFVLLLSPSNIYRSCQYAERKFDTGVRVRVSNTSEISLVCILSRSMAHLTLTKSQTSRISRPTNKASLKKAPKFDLKSRRILTSPPKPTSEAPVGASSSVPLEVTQRHVPVGGVPCLSS